MSFLASFLLILSLVVFSGILSCAEIALAAARKVRLEIMAKDGNANAARVLQLQSQPGSFITMVQIGLNAVAILGGVVAEPALSPHIEGVLGKIYGGAWSSEISFSLSFLFITGFFILFADLLPKRLAMIAPEKAAMMLVGVMLFLEKLFKPLILLFNGMSKIVLTALGLPQVRHDIITYGEIHAVMDAGAEAGVLKHQEHQLIENVLELESRYVPSAMTARDSIIYFLLSDTVEDIQAKFIQHPHARFLVCENNIDGVLGYIDSKDVLKRLIKGENFSLLDRGMIHPPLMIPDSLNLWEVMERMKSVGEDLAVVVNEYALVVGIISISDVTSVLMGKLLSLPEEEQQIVRRDQFSWLMDGLTPLAEVMNELGIDDYPNPVGYETLSGFIMYMLRKIPKKTDFVVFDGYKFEVVDIEGHRINQLLVTKLTKEQITAKQEQRAKEAESDK